MDDMDIPSGLSRAKLVGRRTERPRTKWLQETNKNARCMGIRHDNDDDDGQPHWIGMCGGGCLWRPGPLEGFQNQRKDDDDDGGGGLPFARGYGSGIQTVFLGTQGFHGRLTGVPEAHFLYFEVGRYICLDFFILSPLCVHNLHWVFYQCKSAIIYFLNVCKYFIFRKKGLCFKSLVSLLCPNAHFYFVGVPRKFTLSHRDLTSIESLKTSDMTVLRIYH
jgi:hypothetical protein